MKVDKNQQQILAFNLSKSILQKQNLGAKLKPIIQKCKQRIDSEYQLCQTLDTKQCILDQLLKISPKDQRNYTDRQRIYNKSSYDKLLLYNEKRKTDKQIEQQGMIEKNFEDTQGVKDELDNLVKKQIQQMNQWAHTQNKDFLFFIDQQNQALKRSQLVQRHTKELVSKSNPDIMNISNSKNIVSITSSIEKPKVANLYINKMLHRSKHMPSYNVRKLVSTTSQEKPTQENQGKLKQEQIRQEYYPPTQVKSFKAWNKAIINLVNKEYKSDDSQHRKTLKDLKKLSHHTKYTQVGKPFDCL